jgi:hypothetical protein
MLVLSFARVFIQKAFALAPARTKKANTKISREPKAYQSPKTKYISSLHLNITSERFIINQLKRACRLDNDSFAPTKTLLTFINLEICVTANDFCSEL